jgi:hypothetical protein
MGNTNEGEPGKWGANRIKNCRSRVDNGEGDVQAEVE